LGLDRVEHPLTPAFKGGLMIRRLLLSLFAVSFMIATADAAPMTSQTASTQITSPTVAAKPAAAIETTKVVTGRSAWHHGHNGWHHWHHGWHHHWHHGWYHHWHHWHHWHWHHGWHHHWHHHWHY